MRNRKIGYITRGALVSALYVGLTFLCNAIGLANGPIQLRLSEALCILPFFMPSAVPGLFIGCLIANLVTSAAVWDVIFGSLATLVGAFVASKIKNKWLVPIPTVIANTVVVPVVILFCYTAKESWSLQTYFITALGVFTGEVLSAYVLGMILFFALDRHKNSLFK